MSADETVTVGRRQYSKEHFDRIRSISEDLQPSLSAPETAITTTIDGSDKPTSDATTKPIVSETYNRHRRETMLNITLPKGKIGIDIQSIQAGTDKLCRVANKNNQDSPLEVGDIIVSPNGINLSKTSNTSLCLALWTTLFRTEANKGPMILVVRRPDDPNVVAVAPSSNVQSKRTAAAKTKKRKQHPIHTSKVSPPTAAPKPSNHNVSSGSTIDTKVSTQPVQKRNPSTFSAGIGELKALEDRLKAAKKFEKLAQDEVKAAELCLDAAKKKWEVIDVDD